MAAADVPVTGGPDRAVAISGPVSAAFAQPASSSEPNEINTSRYPNATDIPRTSVVGWVFAGSLHQAPNASQVTPGSCL
ncbi:hypothetical protein GCM10009828_098620 [Actinoplanes couchii]|uniref:Uncharacterized protein n=1 Tax=Actinoplanes couchii TaxID=403638 RepID=A0ABQ3XPH5_9ACTN|nr:hypothetical protein Aco03nite_088110 [Actinoplanes couchii]